MIFITTGSRSFQFNRLLKAVDEAVMRGLITEQVFAQTGLSDYCIKKYEYTKFLNHEEFNKNINEADIILTHGGTGVIVNSLKKGKRIVAVPRLKKYGEAIDDHQVQLIEAFYKQEQVTPCFECTAKGISLAIEEAKKKKIKPYISNTKVILGDIDKYIREEGNGSI